MLEREVKRLQKDLDRKNKAEEKRLARVAKAKNTKVKFTTDTKPPEGG